MSIFGVLAAALAAMMAIATVALFDAVAPPSLLGMVVLMALDLAVVLLLFRVRIPVGFRGLMLLGMAIPLVLLVARSDGSAGPAAARPAGGSAEPAAMLAGRGGVAAGGAVPAASGGASGAVVSLTPGRSGDGGWAAALERSLDGRLGGAAAQGLAIRGDVEAQRTPEGTLVAIGWSVARQGVVRPCGLTRALGDDRAALLDQLGAPIRAAIDRSVALDAPSCP